MESEDPNLGIHIVDGEEIYQEYLGKNEEKKKAKENEIKESGSPKDGGTERKREKASNTSSFGVLTLTLRKTRL